MAKVETRNRFRVPVEVSQEELGPLMAAVLERVPSAVIMPPQMITDVMNYRSKATHDTNSATFLEAWIKDHPTFKAIEAVQAFRDDGRGNGSVAYPAIATLVEKKLLKKVGPGEYARADQKALPAPKVSKETVSKKTKKPKPTTQDRRDVDHRAFMLRVASRNHGRFNVGWMKTQFDKDGRKSGNVSPTIKALLDAKHIKRVGDGEYVLMRQDAKKAPAESKMNGATAVESVDETATEATHGV